MNFEQLSNDMILVPISQYNQITIPISDVYLKLADLILKKILEMDEQLYNYFNEYCQNIKLFADEVIELTEEINELYDEGLESECQTKIDSFNKRLKKFFIDTIKIGYSACFNNNEIKAVLIRIEITFKQELVKYDLDYYTTSANSEWMIRKVKIEMNLNESISHITRLSTRNISLKDRFISWVTSIITDKYSYPMLENRTMDTITI
tara:strand:+ start:476 stop:1096 length:621 start_codon:yes stop_codon:yes gene_type:complete